MGGLRVKLDTPLVLALVFSLASAICWLKTIHYYKKRRRLPACVVSKDERRWRWVNSKIRKTIKEGKKNWTRWSPLTLDKLNTFSSLKWRVSSFTNFYDCFCNSHGSLCFHFIIPSYYNSPISHVSLIFFLILWVSDTFMLKNVFSQGKKREWSASKVKEVTTNPE